MIFNFFQDVGNYEQRKVGNTMIKGLRVSTCWTSDEGYETAIEDTVNVYPVERYKTKKLAEKGHLKWCEKARTLKKITRLGGWGGLVEDVDNIILVRSENTKMEINL